MFLEVFAAEPPDLFLEELELNKVPDTLMIAALRHLALTHGCAFVRHIARLSKEVQPSLFTFSKDVLDLGGYSSAGDAMIALHEMMIKMPVAMFHEFCEFLRQSKRLRCLSKEIASRSSLIKSIIA